VTKRGRGWIIVAVLAVAAVLVFGVVRALDGGSGPPVTPTSMALARAVQHAAPASAPFAGLTEVHLAIGGRCLRLAVADTLAERVAGLRGMPDLTPYDGMLFSFGGESDSSFTMSGVTVPLDIGFYRGDGTRDSSRAMKPCLKAEADCPIYSADGEFVYAVETAGGELPAGNLTAC